eukprot:SAG22_NODE_13953_length_389_cov_2.644828_1_plen_55_part_10
MDPEADYCSLPPFPPVFLGEGRALVLVTWDDKPCKCRIQKMDDDNFWVYTAKGGP